MLIRRKECLQGRKEEQRGKKRRHGCVSRTRTLEKETVFAEGNHKDRRLAMRASTDAWEMVEGERDGKIWWRGEEPWPSQKQNRGGYLKRKEWHAVMD